MLEHRAYFVANLNDQNYSSLEEALGRISGVQTPGINTVTHTLRLSFDPAFTSDDAISAAIEASGFQARKTEA